jgi:hypothetical protein
VLAATGFAEASSEIAALADRLLGHVVVMVASVTVFISIGVLGQRGWRRQPVRCLFRSFLSPYSRSQLVWIAHSQDI